MRVIDNYTVIHLYAIFIHLLVFSVWFGLAWLGFVRLGFHIVYIYIDRYIDERGGVLESFRPHRMMRAPVHSTPPVPHGHVYSKPVYIRISIYNCFIHGPREAPALNLSLRTNSHGWLLCCAFYHLFLFFFRLFFSITFHISFVSNRIVVCHSNAHISNSHRSSTRYILSFQPAIPYLVVALSLSLAHFHRCATRILHESEVNKLHKCHNDCCVCVQHFWVVVTIFPKYFLFLAHKPDWISFVQIFLSI